MKYLPLLLLVGMSACSADKSEEPKQKAETAITTPASETTAPKNDKEALVGASKQAIGKFVKSLQGELKKAMKEGGPVNAIQVCSQKATPIAIDTSKQEGMNISRVSLKNRNPNNAPNEWQTKILQDFEAKKAKGEEITALAFAGMVEEGGKKQFRFMKAIPTGDICLACHGAELKPEVATKLAELYPDDKAIGFNKGDIRGAFVITKDLN